ncbi:glycoside hydrolase family 25 protein [Aurantiacibacter poecillastricola]|uniref:glycoside hydrolase family 25 protein n=1 Tax=Aurantiacibacter poecillastricola TaxID=3064385 RepID=UPI00273E661F|nr:glycoside hydrolase family 25 protein [Aurantiacibacter sp. 219JJ12-13]MDP5261009.1 glycoside hydrolase family 25 protein [Aurantiacibacter sp. 219JJ12-13]
MGRKRKSTWRWRIAALLLLVAMVAGGYGWWRAIAWQPERAEYPMQGAFLGERDGAADFHALRSTGADFVYLEASHGSAGRDASFARNLAAASDAELPHGAVHAYDPCVPAEKQAANFVTIVPRDEQMLPPAIALDKLASECGDPIIEAGLESELTTFINQVESHAGQPVVLKVSRAFEAEHGIGTRMERNLWLERDFLEPDYAGRPWTLWTATGHLRGEGSDGALRWVVVQP